MNLENVRREDWIVGGGALLLAIFLLALPWYTASIAGFSASEPATGPENGFLGILALIVLLAIIADLAIERFSPQTQLPVLNTRANTRFVLGIVVAVLLLLKFILHIRFTGQPHFGWGFYVDVILTAALIYALLQIRNGAPLPGVGGPSSGGTSGGPRGGAPATGTPPVGGTTPPVGGTTPPAPGVPPAGGGLGGEPGVGPGGGSTPPPRG